MPIRPLVPTALVAACLSLGSLAPAQATPVPLFVPFAGAGNLVLFDPVTGSGGWVGAIDQSPVPAVPSPLSLVSVVLFSYDALSQTLSGSFELTDATDLGASLFGTVLGSTTEADPFGQGAQFSLDYTITGGTGHYAGASGFGLAFLQFDPDASFNNYREDGLLVINAVPEPGSLPLTLLAGFSLLLALRQGRPLHARLGRGR